MNVTLSASPNKQHVNDVSLFSRSRYEIFVYRYAKHAMFVMYVGYYTRKQYEKPHLEIVFETAPIIAWDHHIGHGILRNIAQKIIILYTPFHELSRFDKRWSLPAQIVE